MQVMSKQATCVVSTQSYEAEVTPNKKEKLNLDTIACFKNVAWRTGTVL